MSENILQEQTNVQTVSEIPAINSQNTVNTWISNMDMIALLSLFRMTISQKVSIGENYDINEDFAWYTSGEANTDPFKGQYIAIWKKKIVANAKTAIEVERIAKSLCGENSRPAIVYVPEDKDAIL
jgi:hypothetical protein